MNRSLILYDKELDVCEQSSPFNLKLTSEAVFINLIFSFGENFTNRYFTTWYLSLLLY